MSGGEGTVGRLSALGRFGDLGLERSLRVLSALGSPDAGVPMVQITGTNGKGSTAAMTAAVLAAAGLDVGLYISPHLSSPYERIQRGGQNIAAAELDALAAELWPVLEREQGSARLTEFEAWTVLAAMAFQRWHVDVAVIEAGLGARYDATSALRGVRASAITSVGLDHMDRLGPDIPSIARDKAGCIRAGRPVVLGDLSADALAEVLPIAQRRGAQALRFGQDLGGTVNSLSLQGTEAHLSIPGLEFDARIGLLGDHQAQNAAVACTLARSLHPGLSVDDMRRGLAAAVWPGRFEVLREEPLLVLDGAHNPHGTAALARAVAALVPAPRKLVFGMLRDRDPGDVLAPLQPLFEEAVFTTAPSPRGRAATELVPYWQGSASAQPDPIEAVRAAARSRQSVVIAGSLYLIGEIRPTLLEDVKSGR